MARTEHKWTLPKGITFVRVEARAPARRESPEKANLREASGSNVDIMDASSVSCGRSENTNLGEFIAAMTAV